MLKAVATVAVAAVSLMAMHEAEINLNNYDVQARVDLDMGQFNETIEPDRVFLGGSYLYASGDHNSVNGAKDSRLMDVHFMVQQPVDPAKDLMVGLGVKGVYTKVDMGVSGDSDFYAVALGAKARYQIPANIQVPIAVGGHIYYAPNVLSMSDAKNYLEWNLEAEAMVIDRAGIVAGYRRIDTNFDSPSVDMTLNESWYIGVKFKF